MARTIVNKFSGTCNVCTVRVAAGAGVATRIDNKWKVLCNAHKGETNGTTNPWKAQHMVAEMDYTGGEYTRRIAKSMVDREYANTDELAEKCDCGGTCHWRATVGARQCTSCCAIVVYKVDQTTGTVTRKLVK